MKCNHVRYWFYSDAIAILIFQVRVTSVFERDLLSRSFLFVLKDYALTICVITKNASSHEF